MPPRTARKDQTLGESGIDSAGRLRNAVKTRSAPPMMPPASAFVPFLAVRLAAAVFSPIQDCDEVFNYWEPTHYLNHGHGLQTWEYSPEYAIRSWFYAGLHASVMAPLRVLPFGKHIEFYFLRIVLAVVCALCETRLYATIQKTFNARVAIFFSIIAVASPGMFHASVAYLPSSFAMYTSMLGISAFMDWRGGLRTAQGIMWFAIGACIGWPFAGALVVPFIAEEVLLGAISRSGLETITRMTDGAIRSLLILALQVSVDTFFFRKLTVVPWNIVKYNVFSGKGKGPDIYGTEPWHFYIRNLIINFNVWFILALLSYPLLLWHHFVRKQTLSTQAVLRGFVFLTPFYLWLSIFTLQLHKEERFMYPIYPALALNAAISLHVLLLYLGSGKPGSLRSKIPAGIKLGLVGYFVLGSLGLGLLRTLSLTTGYTAPLTIYTPLRNANVSHPGDNVCLGKEWYRFPSSYLLPTGVKAKFIKSEFNGLLPGEFSEASAGFGNYPGASLIPPGMNDENKEDLDKYTTISDCNFLVDSYFPGSTPSRLEPNYIEQTDAWETLKCEPFLDNANTGIIGRLLYAPESPFIPERFRRRWGSYCLLRRKHPESRNKT